MNLWTSQIELKLLTQYTVNIFFSHLLIHTCQFLYQIKYKYLYRKKYEHIIHCYRKSLVIFKKIVIVFLPRNG